MSAQQCQAQLWQSGPRCALGDTYTNKENIHQKSMSSDQENTTAWQ